jgi:Tetratricopeptide repeat
MAGSSPAMTPLRVFSMCSAAQEYGKVATLNERQTPMATSVFLSTVTDEFRAYRDQLVHDLTRHNVAVKVQEDFKDLGGSMLDKLDAYIAHCDAVVHLVGEMCGSTADETQQRALLAKYADLQSKLPPLYEALTNGALIPYTQWEAWLALYHGKALLIAKAKTAAPRGPNFAPSDASRAAQAAHLTQLKPFHRYPGSEFGSPDELAKQIAYTAILDLLVEDKAEKVAHERAAAQDAKLDQILLKLAEDKSVPLETLRAILASMGEATASYDAAVIEQKLAAKAAEFRDLADRLNRLSNSDPVVTQLRAEASNALARGSFERVDQLLADAEARDLSGLQDIESLARQKRLSAADTRAQRAAASLLLIHPDAYSQAAAHYGEASRIAGVGDASKAREYLRSQANALMRLGDEFGDNDALREAIKILLAARAAGDRTKDPLDWAMTQNSLGAVLQTLGKRESGTARLKEAVEAYRAALEERRRERVPLDWAMTQNNLGNALWSLGERESGTARLEEAVHAYRTALQEWTRERVPLDWATTQNNLGNALARLGERESGTARLEGAVAAYRAALEERTRERAPLDWATTQNNLGTALQALGQRENGTARLEEAVEACRAALQEWTRERVSLQWVTAQNNLGNALATLGERESGAARLGEAVQAYRAALEERTRERGPLDSAGVQNNLGNALQALGKRESGTGSLEEAVEAYRAALQEWTRERVPLRWAMTQNNLGNALQALGERESGTARLEVAVQAYRAALQEWTRERVPLQWAMTQNNLGAALQKLGERESGTARLEKAVEAFSAALEERTRDRVPLQWATTQNNLGNALRALGEQERGTARLEEAVQAYRAALEERTRARVPLGWAATTGNQGVAMSVLADRTNDRALAETAFQQIQTSYETLRDGGDASGAAIFEAQLQKVQAIRDRLRAK